MKVVTLFLTIFCTVSGFAFSANAGDVRFKKNTVIPSQLQEEIVQALEKNCGSILEDSNLIYESKTTVEYDPEDQSVKDLYYKTKFSVLTMDNDNMHPGPVLSLEVRSVITDYFNSKSRAQVKAIEAEGYCAVYP